MPVRKSFGCPTSIQKPKSSQHLFFISSHILSDILLTSCDHAFAIIGYYSPRSVESLDI